MTVIRPNSISGVTSITAQVSDISIFGASSGFANITAGNISAAGTITYEDVTNVDSVGVITARTGIKIGSSAGVAGTFFADGSYVTAGVITATTFHGSGANLTNINSTSATGDFSIADKIIHTGDTDTAIRFPAADTITAETGGSERLRIDSSGDYLFLGGTLRIKDSGNSAQRGAIYGDASSFHINAGVNNLIAYSAGTERLRIDSSGSVMIGRTSATKPLSVRKLGTSQGVHYIATFGGQNHLAGYAVGIGFDPEGNDNRNKIAIVAEGIGQGYSRGKLHFLLDSANDSGEATLSETRMTINEDGKVDVGTQAGPSHSGVNIAATDYPTLRLWDDQKSDNFVLRYHNSTQRVQFINNHQGVYLGRGDTSFGSLSDERAKTIISNITGGLEKIKSLRTIIGKYNDDPESKSRPFLIAQDVQSVLPEAVDVRDTDNLGLRYTDMIPLLTNALQESVTKIEILEAKVAALEGS